MQPIGYSKRNGNADPILKRCFGRMDIRCHSLLPGDVAMRFIAFLLVLTGLSFTRQFSTAYAQPSIIQQRDGTSGMLSPLGGQEAIYSDAHGHKGVTLQGSGLPSHTFSSPHGALTGPVTPFGTPTPPNLLTPAPLLPIQPRGMATPQPQAPVSSGSDGGSSFSGRPGR